MAGDNFQEVVVLRTDDKLEIRGEAIIIGGTATDAQSVVYRDAVNDLEGHLAWNPAANHTIFIPDVDGTLLISGQAIQGLGVSTLGNTAGNTGTTVGTVVFAGGNQITLSQVTAAGSLATVTISARDAVFGAGVSTGGNTSGSTGTTVGTLVLAGGNNITLSQSTAAGSQATVTVSARNAVFGEGISTGGNTSGTSGTNTGTIVWAGGNQITLSQATGAGGNTITISARDAVFGAGVSTGGNTSGSTGTTVGTLVLAGGNNITLSQSTAAGSNATITVSAPNMVSSAGVSTQGNTTGNTGLMTGSLILAGSNGVTLSQSTIAGGAVVWIQLKKNPIIFFATGRFRVSTGIDIQEAGDAFTISTVVFRREIAGSAGSTTIDVLKNGVSIWNINPGNRPTITAASGNAQRVTAVPDVTSIASTDRLEMVLVNVETGSPQDAVVELIFAS